MNDCEKIRIGAVCIHFVVVKSYEKLNSLKVCIEGSVLYSIQHIRIFQTTLHPITLHYYLNDKQVHNAVSLHKRRFIYRNYIHILFQAHLNNCRYLHTSMLKRNIVALFNKITSTLSFVLFRRLLYVCMSFAALKCVNNFFEIKWLFSYLSV